MCVQQYTIAQLRGHMYGTQTPYLCTQHGKVECNWNPLHTSRSVSQECFSNLTMLLGDKQQTRTSVWELFSTWKRNRCYCVNIQYTVGGNVGNARWYTNQSATESIQWGFLNQMSYRLFSGTCLAANKNKCGQRICILTLHWWYTIQFDTGFNHIEALHRATDWTCQWLIPATIVKWPAIMEFSWLL